MAKKPKKRKGKIKVRTGARIVKRDSVRSDTLQKAPTQTKLPTNGITFKVNMRKK